MDKFLYPLGHGTRSNTDSIVFGIAFLLWYMNHVFMKYSFYSYMRIFFNKRAFVNGKSGMILLALLRNTYEMVSSR